MAKLLANKKRLLELFGILLIASFTQVATDLYVPSIPAIAEYFKVDINMSQLTIAVYMIALTITQLFWGPLADLWGRKFTLTVGLSIGLVGSFVCTAAESMEWLIIGRVIQGIGNGAAAGLWRAMLRDMYTGKELSSIASYFANFLVLILVCAPLLGGFFQEFFNWRLSFAFVFVWAVVCMICLWLLLRETQVKKTLATENWKESYKRLLSSRIFMGCCISNFFTYAGLFVWITSGSPLLIDQMGLSPLYFGFVAMISGLGTMVGATLNGRFVIKVGMDRMLDFGWMIIVLSGLGLTGASMLFTADPLIVLIAVFVYYLGCSFIFANTNATAFGPFGDIAGTAAGLYAFIQMAGGAASSYLLASIGDSSSVVMGLMFLASGIIAWLNYVFMVRMQNN